MASRMSWASTACIYTEHNLIESPRIDQHRSWTNERHSSTPSCSCSSERRGSNQSCLGLQELLDSKGVSLEDLCDLKALLDAECFKITTQENPVPNPDLINQKLGHIAVCLSKPLAICHDEEISAFLEIQLRTLVAAFALLHFQGAIALPSETYDDLRVNKLGSLYSTVCQQKKGGGNPISATNIYLIQLALQYLSLFACFRNREYESTKSIVAIVFSSLMIPAQQYQNSLSIATGIQELARIWRKRERKRHPIVTVQEHVRRVTEALKSCQDPCNLRARDEKMLTTTLDQIQTIFRNELEQNPDSLNAWHSTRNAFQLGPPEINSRYYLYGLLDCTAQLGCAVNIRSVRLDLYVMLEKFVFKTRVKEFRWKAVEALLSYKTTRHESFDRLLQLVEEDWRLSHQQKAQMSSDIQLVNRTLRGAQAKAISRRPIAGDSTQTQENPDFSLDQDSPIVAYTRNSVSSESNYQNSDVSQENFWRENKLQEFRPEETTSELTDLSSELRSELRKVGGKSWDSVGLSTNAQSVYFLSEKVICVFNRVLSRKARAQPVIFERDKKNLSRTKIVALTENFLVLVESDKSIHTISAKRVVDQTTAFICSPKGNQICAMIATESNEFLDIVTAQGKGLVCIYRLAKAGLPSCAATLFSQLQVDDGDSVTHISLGPRNDTIAALTRRNFLFVWYTGPDLTKKVKPFRYWHGYYNSDPGDFSVQTQGLTSACLYSPPNSPNTYTFCTSFPSRTCCRSKGNWEINGEWSYIVPNRTSPSSSTPPSSHLIENLTQFADQGGLTTGVVSSTANVFAVLEKYKGERRRVLWMPIQAHEMGGIQCPETKPSAMAFVLEGKDQTDDPGQGSCALAFRDRDGKTCLVAADIKGRIWEVQFEAV